LTKCKTDLKAVRTELLNVCCAPRMTLNIEVPQAKPQEISKAINQNIIRPIATATEIKPTNYIQINQIPIKNIKEVQQQVVNSNICSNRISNTVVDYRGNQKMPIKDKTNITCNSNKRLIGESQNIMGTNITLDRNLPIASFSVNKGTKNIDLNSNIQSRSYTLPERTQRGSFSNYGNMSK